METDLSKHDEAKRITRRLARGGRRRAAFIFDAAFLWLIAAFAVYIAVRTRLKNRAAALLAAGAIIIEAFALWLAADRKLLARRERAFRERARREAAEAKLRLEPSPVLLKACEAGAVVSDKTDVLTCDDLRLLLPRAFDGAEGLTLVSFAKPTEAAEEFLSALPYEVKLVSPCEFLGKTQEELAPVSDDETDGFIIRKYGLKKRPRIKAGLLALSRERAAKYAAAGFGLMLLSLFMRYSLLYRLMGSLTLSLSAGIFAIEAMRGAKRAP